MLRIVAAAIATAIALAYLALALADPDAAVAWMPEIIGVMLLAIGVDGITRQDGGDEPRQRATRRRDRWEEDTPHDTEPGDHDRRLDGPPATGSARSHAPGGHGSARRRVARRTSTGASRAGRTSCYSPWSRSPSGSSPPAARSEASTNATPTAPSKPRGSSSSSKRHASRTRAPRAPTRTSSAASLRQLGRDLGGPRLERAVAHRFPQLDCTRLRPPDPDHRPAPTAHPDPSP
jgi:hypothetical protein